MGDLAGSGWYANAQRNRREGPRPPVAPAASAVHAWGTATVVAGWLLLAVGPVTLLWLLDATARDAGGTTGLVTPLLVLSLVLACLGVALVALGRGVRAVAWLAHQHAGERATQST
ncbi:hypothetical protein [Aquipuribacter nitratireducens]|uniref:Uncharacterized protein n=1 Tax=Aquipuribacter nitratireducens TaxID=650104 RepID=A0ABW0GMY9_9MICO